MSKRSSNEDDGDGVGGGGSGNRLPSYMRDNRLSREGGRGPNVPPRHRQSQQRKTHKRSSSYSGANEDVLSRSFAPPSRRRTNSVDSRRRPRGSGLPSEFITSFQDQYNVPRHETTASLYWEGQLNSMSFDRGCDGQINPPPQRQIAPHHRGMNNNALSGRPLVAQSQFVDLSGDSPEQQNNNDIIEDDTEGEWSGKFVLLFKKLLNAKSVGDNNQTYSQQFYKEHLLDKLVANRSSLLKLAKAMDGKQGTTGDDRVQVVLNKVLDNRYNKKIGKRGMVDIFVDTWRVLENLDLGELKRDVRSSLNEYITLMEETSSKAQAAVERDNNVNMNSQSAKLPANIKAAEESRGYREGGATQPGMKYGLGECPACQRVSMHEPPENNDLKKEFNKKKKAWEKICKQIDDAKKGNGTYPTDSKGKNIMKHPTMPALTTYMICKQVKMVHSHGVGGYTCGTCTDRTCDDCKNKCTFVTTHQ